ncbi:5-oxoprolinase subunit PxpB [Pseudobacillus wudalianchiensis]|uniref:Kinase inhibitor n=1 Tax=Pseudobacillus wudalianchiensis TaxID=1743143 RepID=A0A1B9AE65_9BACI|nr:5-oxoprolinase subunit PxpB [Bacillus wudalianchiensis]OCA82120.1 kinase inhibitor [Bacillus wudalianchiensis]
MSDCFTETIMKPLGDSALIVQLGEGISPSIHQKVQALSRLLNTHPFDGFIESVPAFNNMTIHYNPAVVYRTQRNNYSPLTPFQVVCAKVNELVQYVDETQSMETRVVEIPVLYGGEYGPDLDYVASYHQISAEEVIRLHTQGDCLVYMLGFAPGFPFVGGMDERIATPRRETPRLAIAPGSVGIAGKQTGVYPVETPGGWQIIGRTPLDLFRPDLTPPTLLQAGDKIKFVQISPEEYQAYKEKKK